jgi:hypothetical protein
MPERRVAVEASQHHRPGREFGNAGSKCDDYLLQQRAVLRPTSSRMRHGAEAVVDERFAKQDLEIALLCVDERRRRIVSSNRSPAAVYRDLAHPDPLTPPPAPQYHAAPPLAPDIADLSYGDNPRSADAACPHR